MQEAAAKRQLILCSNLAESFLFLRFCDPLHPELLNMNPSDRVSPALLTDLYQLTMAYGYWKEGKREKEAVFHLTFRHQPFGSGYTIACGLEDAVEYLENFRF